MKELIIEFTVFALMIWSLTVLVWCLMLIPLVAFCYTFLEVRTSKKIIEIYLSILHNLTFGII